MLDIMLDGVSSKAGWELASEIGKVLRQRNSAWSDQTSHLLV